MMHIVLHYYVVLRFDCNVHDDVHHCNAHIADMTMQGDKWLLLPLCCSIAIISMDPIVVYCMLITIIAAQARWGAT